MLLGIPLYQLFYEGKKNLALPRPLKRKAADEAGWGATRQETRDWERFRDLLARMKESDRRILLDLAQKMAGRRSEACIGKMRQHDQLCVLGRRLQNSRVRESHPSVLPWAN